VNTLRLTRTIPAPPERVFNVWTDTREIRRWAGPGEVVVRHAEVDLRVGGKFRTEMASSDGTIVRAIGVYRVVDPPRKLEYTWSWETNPPAGESIVTVEFLDRQGTTELVLVHEGLPDAVIRDRHEKGWIGSLAKLAALFRISGPTDSPIKTG
jgi:uncharacterized protein YndB with AHSA1/START domain